MVSGNILMGVMKESNEREPIGGIFQFLKDLDERGGELIGPSHVPRASELFVCLMEEPHLKTTVRANKGNDIFQAMKRDTLLSRPLKDFRSSCLDAEELLGTIQKISPRITTDYIQIRN